SGAESLLTSAGLIIGTVSEEYSATVPAGQIIRQSPTASSVLQAGSAVAIWVSQGLAPISVPDLSGQTLSGAESLLTSAGLIIGTVSEEYSATVPAGQVIRQSPTASSVLQAGSAVAIWVSQGSTPIDPTAPVVVPDLSGQTQTTATSILAATGLLLGVIHTEYDANVPAGQIIRHMPTANSSVPPNTPVELWISKGVALSITPTSVTLEVENGKSYETSFTISGGILPYRLELTSSNTDIHGQVSFMPNGNIHYSIEIPANAPPGLTLEDTLSISDGTGSLVTASVTANIKVPEVLSTLPNLSPNERSVARALENSLSALSNLVNPTPEQQDLRNQILNLIAAPDAPGTRDALKALTNSNADAAGISGIQTGTQQLTNLNTRLLALRRGATGIDLRGLALMADGQVLSGRELTLLTESGQSGGGASADNPFGRWGFFLNGRVDFGNRSQTDNQTGFDFRITGITGGIDYRFSEKFIAGGALGYSSNSTNFDVYGGSLDTKTLHLAAYATLSPFPQTYIDAVIDTG
ncbi:PASTA domain, binds beta-lactams, partial [Allochromatium warmingii]